MTMKPPVLNRMKSLMAVVAAVVFCAFVRAGVPEPDNVLYGTISLDGEAVTAGRSDIVIEARRTANGPALVRYRMGTDSAVGNFYSLRLPLESSPPVVAPNASVPGESVVIVVTDASGVRAETTFTFVERAAVQRVDFGVSAVDGDGDGIPDAWELSYFTDRSRSGDSIAPNGSSVMANYVAGTDPRTTNGLFKLDVAVNGSLKSVTLPTKTATGAGYEGKQRRYALEATTNLATGWFGLTGYTNIAATDQPVVFQTTADDSPAFFRGRVWLDAP
jgi:hypothetical protein